MKLSVVGKIEDIKKVVVSESKKQDHFSWTGFYSSDTISSAALQSLNIQQFSSIDEMIDHSEMLYIYSDDRNAFEISKKAVKNSVHLLFESPYIFGEEQFEELFKYANETNVLLKFNQELLQRPLIKNIRFKTQPDYLQVRINKTETESEQEVNKSLFHFATILRSQIQSGIRKIHTCGTIADEFFSLYIQMDNGSCSELLYNTLNEKGGFQLELFFKGKRIQADLQEGALRKIRRNAKGVSADEEILPEKKDDSISKELKDVIKNLPDLRSEPTTIREENHYLLYLTHQLRKAIQPA